VRRAEVSTGLQFVHDTVRGCCCRSQYTHNMVPKAVYAPIMLYTRPSRIHESDRGTLRHAVIRNYYSSTIREKYNNNRYLIIRLHTAGTYILLLFTPQCIWNIFSGRRRTRFMRMNRKFQMFTVYCGELSTKNDAYQRIRTMYTFIICTYLLKYTFCQRKTAVS